MLNAVLLLLAMFGYVGLIYRASIYLITQMNVGFQAIEIFSKSDGSFIHDCK